MPPELLKLVPDDQKNFEQFLENEDEVGKKGNKL